MNTYSEIQKKKFYTFFSISFVLLCIDNVITGSVPSIACPNIFQYVRHGNDNGGQITLRDLPLSTIEVSARFEQRESIPKGSTHKLSLSQDLHTTRSNIENNLPVLYNVQFPNPNLLPKLTQISVNNQIICSAQRLSPPSSSFTLYHTFYPTTKNKGTTFQYHTPNTDVKPTLPSSYNNNPFLGQYTKKRPQPTSGSKLNIIPIPTPAPNPISTSIRTPIPTPTQTSKPVVASASTECGREGDGFIPFMVGGNDFHREKFPWLTAIYLRHGVDLRFTCGGTLISLRTVITAAHCFLDPSITADHIVVFLGRHNLYETEEGAIQRDIQKLIKHPEFNVSALADADVAILHLKSPVGVTQFIRPICLWTQSADLNFIVGQRGFVAGWGSNNHGQDVTPLAKMVDAKIVSEIECLRSNEMFRLLTSPRTFCAGNRDGTGPCLGDSGGSLMINIFGVWTLRGIVSIGQVSRGNCNLREYIVYCDIAKHMTWVRENIAN